MQKDAEELQVSESRAGASGAQLHGCWCWRARGSIVSFIPTYPRAWPPASACHRIPMRVANYKIYIVRNLIEFVCLKKYRKTFSLLQLKKM